MDQLADDRLPQLLFSPAQVHGALAKLVKSLADRFGGKRFTLVPVLEGGVFVFARMASILHTAGLKFDYRMVRVGRTSAAGKFREPIIDGQFLQSIEQLKGKRVVYLDDICDRGETFLALEKVSSAAGAKSVTCVSLIDRKIDKVRSPDIVGLETESTHWLFGSGMDLSGAHRELEGVHGVADPTPGSRRP